jgi:hypothetical protein
VINAVGTEGLLRQLAPQVLGAVVRRYGDFAGAEDAVQEALLAAATTWPTDGTPENPLAWLVRVASRRMTDQYRRDDARRRREDLAASWSLARPDPPPGHDDTLILIFMCCHPSLTPASAIPLPAQAPVRWRHRCPSCACTTSRSRSTRAGSRTARRHPARVRPSAVKRDELRTRSAVAPKPISAARYAQKVQSVRGRSSASEPSRAPAAPSHVTPTAACTVGSPLMSAHPPSAA